MRKNVVLPLMISLGGALLITALMFLFPWYADGVVGNVCGPQGNEICIGPVLRAGFPFAYIIDNPGVSVVGRLEGFLIDEFIVWAFVLDMLIYAVVLYGIWFIVRTLKTRPFKS